MLVHNHPPAGVPGSQGDLFSCELWPSGPQAPDVARPGLSEPEPFSASHRDSRCPGPKADPDDDPGLPVSLPNSDSNGTGRVPAEPSHSHAAAEGGSGAAGHPSRTSRSLAGAAAAEPGACLPAAGRLRAHDGPPAVALIPWQ